ncbi:MAG TPA: amidohydrolase family protein [Nakamurella sp.]|nr:amidohydrolase family protein [Nakamurella sp.]
MTTQQSPARGSYLIRGGTVVSVDPGIGVAEHCDVLVRDGRIVDVAVDLPAGDAEVIDASRMMVMPGLIDSHFHMWSSLGRNFIGEDYGYFPAKWATSAHYQPEDFYHSVLLGLVEAANAGITTVHNWSHNTRTPEHADAELRAHRDGLIRARYAYGHRDMLPEDTELSFTDIDRVAGEWFDGNDAFDGLVHLGVNLRGPDLGDMPVFLAEMAQVRERGLPVAIHTMQGGSTKVDAAELERLGFLGPDFLICHFLAATAADRAAMARTGTPLSYSVHSELRLGDAGDPRTALLRWIEAGVTVSLSIDATSIHPVNLFEAMSVAWNMGIPWEGTDTAHLPAVRFADCIEMATINGARALGLGDVTGSLTPGKRADIILIRADDLNVAPVVNVASTVVRSVTPANVDTVMSDGRIVKRGGTLVAFDAPAVVANAQRSAAGVLARSKA